MYIIHTDGSCTPNPGEMGVGVLIERNGKVVEEISERIGHGTNNIAEFQALLRALRWLKGKNEPAHIFMDSKMIQEGYNKEWTYRKTPHLKKLQDECLALKRELPFVKVSHIPREQNQRADELSTRRVPYASLNSWQRIKLETRDAYTIPESEQREEQTIQRDLFELEMSYN